MSFKNWEEAQKYFAEKENVIEWFGERGIFLKAKRTKGCLHLSKSKWIDGMLFYSIKGDHDRVQSIEVTAPRVLEMCYTHRINGSSIKIHEPYSEYYATFKELPKIAKVIKQNNDEWESYIAKERQERQEENETFIKSLKIGDILEYRGSNEFWQVIEKIDLIIKVKLLSTYGDFADDSLKNYIWYSIKDDFDASEKIETRDKTASAFGYLYKEPKVKPDRNRILPENKEARIKSKEFFDTCKIGDILSKKKWGSLLTFQQIVGINKDSIITRTLKDHFDTKDGFFANFAIKDDFDERDNNEIEYKIKDIPKSWDGNKEWIPIKPKQI